MQLIDNNVTYTNVLTPNIYLNINGPLSAKKSYRFDENENIVHRQSDFLVNAIDIHWNGATIDDTVINTTDDLLKWISDTKSQVNPVDSEKLDNLENTILLYQDTFNGLLSKSYAELHFQPKGEYLTSDDIDTIVSQVNDLINISNFYTKDEANGRFLTEHQSLDGINSAISDIADVVNNNAQNVYSKKEADDKFLTTHQSLEGYATESYVSNEIAKVVGEAPETLDTLKEIADALEDNAKLSDITEAISVKANVEDVYDKDSIDGKIADLNEEISLKANSDTVYTKEESSDLMDEKTLVIASALNDLQNTKADSKDIYNKTEIDDKYNIVTNSIESLASNVYSKKEADDQFLTTHQSLEGYATESYVSNEIAKVVGEAPETLDTLKEIADALEDNAKLSDITEAISGKANVEDVYTKEDADARFLTEVPTVDLTGFATTTSVNESLALKANSTDVYTKEESDGKYLTEVPKDLIDRLNALEKFVNRYVTLTSAQQQTVANDLTVTETLSTTNSVTIEEGTIADIVVPETTKTTTITGELDPNSTLDLTSPKSVTINNTGAEFTNLIVSAPAEGATPTVTLKSGVYDTVTVQDASLTVSNDATVQNVVITPETTKSTTINATFVEGATITSNSEAPITVTNKNAEGEEVSVTLNAPGSTVTLSGGKWTTISGQVSENTLIIKGTAKIQSLNLTKGNVIVEVPRDEDIHNVITGEITLGEGYTITHRTYDITNDNSSKLGGIGEMILQEDITRTSSITAPLAPAYNAVWNLNGHNITVEGTPKYGVYLNRYTSNLEVKGTGTIHAEGAYGLWNAATTGKIIVNDGVTVEAQTHVLYAEKGTIEVNGGSFKLTNAADLRANNKDIDQNGNFKFLLNCYDTNYTNGTANIIVKGGKFYGFNPAESYGELNGPVSFVAEGYESVPTNEAYEYGTVYEVRPINSTPVTE